MNRTKEYQLRKAAGTFWLLHMTQSGMPFEKPMMLNDCGARIWENYAAGASQEEIVHLLQETYGISEEMASEDTKAFLRELEEHMK